MANLNIDTQSAGYQTRLTQIQEIRAFYAPRLNEYLKESPERQAIWRAKDPILNEFLTIIEKFNAREDVL